MKSVIDVRQGSALVAKGPQLDVTPDAQGQVTLTVLNLPAGSTFSFIVNFVDPSFTPTPLILAQVSFNNITIIGGQTVVATSTVEGLNRSFDEDSDAITNLNEVCGGSDPRNGSTPSARLTVKVVKVGTGSGTVTSADFPGIACGNDCQESYATTTRVTLTPIPASDSVFTGWSGGGCSGTGSCTVTMDQAKDVTASFGLTTTTTVPIHRVSVDSAGNEGNLSSSSPAISADGKFVAFASFASNLVPGDTNGTKDIFVKNNPTGSPLFQ